MQQLEQVCYQVREHWLVLFMELTEATQGPCSSQEKDVEMQMVRGGQGDGKQLEFFPSSILISFTCSKRYLQCTTISLVSQPGRILHIPIPSVLQDQPGSELILAA